MYNEELGYLELLESIVQNSDARTNRTSVGTWSVFAPQMRFNLLNNRLPLFTTKKVWFKGIAEELLWMLRGETNIKSLQDKGVKIWDEWAEPDGYLGPVYGKQWRDWGDQGVDQINDVIGGLKKDPYGRRHIVTAWNPDDIGEMKLPPCHCFFQFYVEKLERDTYLSCQLYQRSADMFLGVPFNVASYALLTSMVAQCVGMKPNKLIVTFGDAHVYMNHKEQVKEQVSRVPMPSPKLFLNPNIRDIDEFTYKDFTVEGYQPYPALKGKVAV